MRILILILVFAGHNLFAQSNFMHTYGAYGLFNEGNSIAIDTNSNAYLCGSTGGSGARNGDMVVIKTDSLGNELWNKVYGDSATETGISIKTHPQNGFIALGTSNSGVNNDYQLFVIRADSNGTILWSRIFGATGWDEAAEVAITSDGGFVIASTEWLDGDNSTKMTIWKLNAQGDVLWSNQPQALGSSKAYALAEMADSTLLIGGSGTYNIGQPDDMQLAKYTKDGNLLWYQSYGTEYQDWIADIAITNDQRIGIAGNRRVDENTTNPLLYSLDSDGLAVTQVIDGGIAEVTSIAYGPYENTYFLGWNYFQAGIPKAAIFNFTLEFNFKCNSIPPIGNTIPMVGSQVIPGENGRMILIGTTDETGPGIRSLAMFVCDSECNHDGTLQVKIDDVESEQNFNLYPNPSNGYFQVAMQNAENIKSIQIFDIAGRTHPCNVSKHANSLEISTNNLASGVYYLTLEHPTLNAKRIIPIMIQK
jgi:hypothetical protein